MEKLQTYTRLAAKHLVDAEALVAKGDFVQAGEKLWGSVAEAVKAAAARRGIQLRSHAEIWRFVLRLDREYPDKDFYVLFAVADHLHSNFYEDELPDEAVTAAVPKIKELVTRLQSA